MLKMQAKRAVTSFIHFPVHNIRLQAITSAPLERTDILVEDRKNMNILHLHYFFAISGLEGNVNLYKPICMSLMHATHTHTDKA
jgi:hypothetical protein